MEKHTPLRQTLAVIVAAALVACGLALGAGLSTNGTAVVGVEKAYAAPTPKLSKKTLSLEVGKSAILKVKKAKGKKIVWKSSKKSVATVTNKGKVTAKKDGKSVITAKVAGKKLKCKVTVGCKHVWRANKVTQVGRWRCNQCEEVFEPTIKEGMTLAQWQNAISDAYTQWILHKKHTWGTTGYSHTCTEEEVSFVTGYTCTKCGASKAA